MKNYIFNIDISYMDMFFKPVKNKLHIIELLMNSIKYMLINPPVKEDPSKGKIILNVDKMSRLFFVKTDKYFSISFPFYIKYENVYSFNFRNEMNIDHKITSDVIALIKDNSFTSSCSLDFADKISTYQEDSFNDNFWEFLRELLFMEDGYLRYDYDHGNYIKHDKSDIHPLNHYDFFYTSNATFKVGLREKLTEDDFVDLLNIRTDCKFIS